MPSTVIKLEGSREVVAQMGSPPPEVHCICYCKAHLKVKPGVRSSQTSGAFPIIRPPHSSPPVHAISRHLCMQQQHPTLIRYPAADSKTSGTRPPINRAAVKHQVEMCSLAAS
jgi:hypothetical protein